VKIVQAVGWFYPESWGGTEIYVDGLSRRLRAAGHDVLIAAPDPNHSGERQYEHHGLPVYRYPIPAAPTADEAQSAVLVRGAERFHAWLRRTAPDVVHFHTFVTGLSVLEVEAARALGARVVVTTHAASLGFLCGRGTLMRWGAHACDAVVDETKCAACMLQQRGMPRAIATLVSRTPALVAALGAKAPGKPGAIFRMPAFIRAQRDRQRRVLAAADRFVVLTRWAREAVIANGAPPAKVAINRLGLNVSRPARQRDRAPRSTGGPLSIGYIGRLDPIKGVETFVRAVASLPSDVAVRAVIHGPTFNEAERIFVTRLKAVARGDARISFGPAIPHAQIGTALASFDVLCCPSIVIEGGPTIALEAHAAGTPVVGARVPGLTEIVTDGVNGRLVEAGDWQALARVIAEMASDPGSTVDQWRTCLPPARSLDAVTREYLQMYAA